MSFRKSGADIISIHAEACKDPVGAMKIIRGLGARAGIVINPETPVSCLSGKLAEADMVLVMSVHPGFGGQSFIPHSLDKIIELKTMIRSVNPDILIEVDGGVDLQNASTIVNAGVNVLLRAIPFSPPPILLKPFASLSPSADRFFFWQAFTFFSIFTKKPAGGEPIPHRA